MSHVHQFRLDIQAVAALYHLPSEDRPDMEVLPHFARIRFLTLVDVHKGTRHYTQLGQLREVVDEILGDAVAEIFGIGIGTYVHERHHCQ